MGPGETGAGGGGAYQAAEAWKDHDPQALAASQRINEEVQRRYGINTHDRNGDVLYLQSGVGTQQAARARGETIREHQNAMALIVAAQAEEARRNAAALRPQIERHNVPEEYLTNPGLVDVLEASRDAARDQRCTGPALIVPITVGGLRASTALNGTSCSLS